MATSKIAQASQELADKVVDGYKKIEDTVVGGYEKVEQGAVGSYKKVEDAFVERYLTRDGESVEQAKERMQNSRDEREASVIWRAKPASPNAKSAARTAAPTAGCSNRY